MKAIIVGGGIMGLSVAWALARDGHAVERALVQCADKIEASDLLPLKEYEAQRKALKANLIPLKKLRRIEV